MNHPLGLLRNPYCQRGVALITVLMLVAVMSAILATYFVLTNVELSMTRSTRAADRGYYAAEAGLNIRAKLIRNSFEGFNRPAGMAPPESVGQLPCQGPGYGSGDFGCQAFTMGSRDVATYVEEQPGNPTTFVIPAGERFEYLTAGEYRYSLFSVAHSEPERPEAILEMKINSRVVPLFQFAAFYDKDLEILPGPDMTLAGPVHVNGNLYVGAGSSLTIEGQVTTTEHLYHGRKEKPGSGDQCSGGSVHVHDSGGSPVSMPACGSPTPGRTDVTDTSPWNGTVQTGVDVVTVPAPEMLDPTPGELYWDRADLRIMYDVPSGTVRVRKQDGGVHPNSGLLTGCSGAVDTTYSLDNRRENTKIRMLEVDVRQVLTCLDNNPGVIDGKTLADMTDGGLVWYLGVSGPSADTVNNYGVRVTNGDELTAAGASPPAVQGMTIVTSQALYIHGDFNKTNRKPAAFLADSLNVLSNAWVDNPGGGDDDDDGSPPHNGSDTTIHAAFLAGTDTTGGFDGAAGEGQNEYNGGLENYPRFHENWSSATLTYRGSFVSLNEPRHVDGLWEDQDYSPPTRDWSFESDFTDAANLPPLTPRFVYIKQELYVREFDL
ncbi:MAG: hypothetical protein GY716_23255 [bacterium]|nr:hypothetical protein [bacterium]